MSRIDAFFFAPVDPWTARIFRVLLVVVVAAVFWPSDRPPIGAVTRWAGGDELWQSVFLTPMWWGATLLGLAAFAAGVGGRWTGLAVALLLLPVVPMRGAQSRQVLLITWVAFSLLSTDGRRGSAGPLWPVRLIQLQLSVLYAVNAWAKLTPEFLSGEVLVGFSRVLPNFLVDLSDGSLHLGPLAVPVALCAVGTVVVEAALAVGFWIPRLRWATAALGVAFHLSLQWVITIGWLDWTSLFLYLAFLLPFEAQSSTQGDGPSR